MPSWQAQKLQLEVKPWTDIVVRGADGRPLAIEGVTELYAQDPEAAFWKKVKFIVTTTGNWILISPNEKKQLLLLSKYYPCFVGKGRQRRSCDTRPQTHRKESPQGSWILAQTQSQRRRLRLRRVLLTLKTLILTKNT